MGTQRVFKPTLEFTSAELTEHTVHRRAVEAAIWGMPAVNTDLVLQEMLTKTNGKVNQIVYWGRPLDWRNQTLTPNPDAIYFMAFFNTKDAGPLVIDVPPGDANASLNGNIVTAGFPPFWEGSHWTMPTLPEAMEGHGTTYANHDRYAIDARTLLYTYGYIAIKHAGTGQFYLISIRDRNGNPYDGGKAYRLTVPTNVPIEQY